MRCLPEQDARRWPPGPAHRHPVEENERKSRLVPNWGRSSAMPTQKAGSAAGIAKAGPQARQTSDSGRIGTPQHQELLEQSDDTVVVDVIDIAHRSSPRGRDRISASFSLDR